MTLRVGFSLLFVVLGASIARADPRPVIGARGGFAQQVHFGDVVYFQGNGVVLALEAGVGIQGGLTLLVAIERGPDVSAQEPPPYRSRDPEPVELRDLSVLAIAEGERDRFVFGGGVGVVVETVTTVRWEFDSRGPIAMHLEDESRTGVIGVARGGIRLTSDGPQVLIVGQLSAHTISEQRTLHAYGASVGMTVRWR